MATILRRVAIVASSRKAIVAAVAADLAIAALKLVGGAITGSSVMVAEGIHSIVDGANASLILLGQRRARRPPTSRHPFGHGMEVYFWTVIVAMVTFVLGGGFAVVEGLLSWRSRGGGRVGLDFAILGGAFVFNAVSLAIATRELKRYQRESGYRGSLVAVIRQSHDPAIFIAVVEDVASLAGLVVAALGLLCAWLLRAPAADAIASIVDGVLLMAMAGLLGWETRSLIVGESAGQPLVDDVRRVIRAEEGLGTIDKLDSLQLGPDAVLLMLHARPDADLGAGELGEAARRLERRLRARHPSIRHVVFDFD